MFKPERKSSKSKNHEIFDKDINVQIFSDICKSDTDSCYSECSFEPRRHKISIDDSSILDSLFSEPKYNKTVSLSRIEYSDNSSVEE